MTVAVTGKLIVHTKSSHSGAPTTTVVGSDLTTQDMEDGGVMQLSGVVTVLDVPARRKVVLLDCSSHRVVRETWSDPTTGQYEFDHIRDGKYTAIAYDHTGTYDPEAKTKLTPEPM